VCVKNIFALWSRHVSVDFIYDIDDIDLCVNVDIFYNDDALIESSPCLFEAISPALNL